MPANGPNQGEHNGEKNASQQRVEEDAHDCSFARSGIAYVLIHPTHKINHADHFRGRCSAHCQAEQTRRNLSHMPSEKRLARRFPKQNWGILSVTVSAPCNTTECSRHDRSVVHLSRTPLVVPQGWKPKRRPSLSYNERCAKIPGCNLLTRPSAASGSSHVKFSDWIKSFSNQSAFRSCLFNMAGIKDSESSTFRIPKPSKGSKNRIGSRWLSAKRVCSERNIVSNPFQRLKEVKKFPVARLTARVQSCACDTLQ